MGLKFFLPTEPPAVRVPAHPAPVDHSGPHAGAGGLLWPVHVPLDQVCWEPFGHEENLHLPALHGGDSAFSGTHQVLNATQCCNQWILKLLPLSSSS